MKFRLLLAIMGTVLTAGLATAAEKIVYSSNESGNYDIWMMSPDGSEKTQITNSLIDEFYPRISHDGETIAFTRLDGGNYHGNIYLFEVETGAITQYTAANDVADALSWSPDDSKLAYSRSCGGRQIAVIDMVTAEVTVLTSCSAGAYGAIWHPSDDHIYYWDYIGGGGGWGMYSVPATGGSPARTDSWTFYDTEWSFNPANPDDVLACATPNGQSLTAMTRLDRSTGSYFVLHGGEGTADRSPVWSPDGTKAAFVSMPQGGTASNIYTFDLASGTATQLTFLAEGGLFGSIPEVSWGTISDRSLLYLPSVATKPCDSCEFVGPGPQIPYVVQPVVGDLAQEATAATISLKIPIGVEVRGVSFDGLITENWDYKVATIRPDSGFLTVGLANTLGLRIPTGVSTLFNVEFIASRACNASNYIHWDTALSASAGRRLEFTDVNFQGFVPTFDFGRDSTEILGYRPGDVNDDGTISIGDVSLLIDHLFIAGTRLCVLNAADVNHSCGPGNTDATISDVALLIDTLFVSGLTPLQCGCITPPVQFAAKANSTVALSAQFEDGMTTISVSSPVALRGLQLLLRGPEGAVPVNLVSDKLDQFYGQAGNMVRLGMIDADGGQTVAAGVTQIVRLPGEFEIVSGVVVDNRLQELVPMIGGGQLVESLPTTFALSQNYPNPFNPVTEVTFALPVAADVRLEVFNVLGQSVATIVEQHLDAGEHSVSWDASSQASGVYMYRLTAGDYSETKKMLLLK